jgi:hypothetical protein
MAFQINRIVAGFTSDEFRHVQVDFFESEKKVLLLGEARKHTTAPGREDPLYDSDGAVERRACVVQSV